MSEFHYQPVFSLDEQCGTQLKVSVTFDTATQKPLSVGFSHPDSYQSVSVPFDLWERVVAAVARNLEY